MSRAQTHICTIDLQLPAVELKLVGPSIDWVVRRTRMADTDNFRRAVYIGKSKLRVNKLGKNLSKGMGERQAPRPCRRRGEGIVQRDSIVVSQRA